VTTEFVRQNSLGAVLHESCRNSAQRKTSKIAQTLVGKGIKNFSHAGCFTFSTVAQTMSFAVPYPGMNHRKKRFKGVGDHVCTHREPGILITCERRSLSPCHSRTKGDGSWAEPIWKTAHRRIPAEGVSWTASPSRFFPPPLVPGLFSFRARVISLTDGPTRPTQRLPVPETRALEGESSQGERPRSPERRRARTHDLRGDPRAGYYRSCSSKLIRGLAFPL
jgi:hypothetical protein